MPSPCTKNQILLFLGDRLTLSFAAFRNGNTRKYIPEQQIVVHSEVQNGGGDDLGVAHHIVGKPLVVHLFQNGLQMQRLELLQFDMVQ